LSIFVVRALARGRISEPAFSLFGHFLEFSLAPGDSPENRPGDQTRE
jgi:hypothetical protein